MEHAAMLHDPNDARVFPHLTPGEIETLKASGEIVNAKKNDVILREGDGDYCFYVVLSGKVRVFKGSGATEELLAFHGPGEFTGEISMLGASPAVVSLRAVEDSSLLCISREALRRLIAGGSPLALLLLNTLLSRTRQVDSVMIREEKLAALGKMAAGLAHELNNPATAARRASTLMVEAVLQTPLRMLTVDERYSPEEKEKMRQFAVMMQNRAAKPPKDPLELSDREQEISDWLEANNVPRSSDIAPVYAEAGVTTAELDSWKRKSGAHFLHGVFWLETVVRLSSLARDIESSTGRISELVCALKEYSYMDQARLLEIDVHDGLENTLRVMHHKLVRGIEVRRDYATDLPKICAYPGELKQVWTNLIDNAVDAMEGSGILTLRTHHDGGCVVVEIGDTGAGIPKAVAQRIFEPFFTTKPQGKGTGLGLDITYRIVVFRHGGEIAVRSRPGETVFSVSLPVEPPRAAELAALAVESRENKL